MEIETLNNAARAAGFAMAADEPHEEPKRDAHADQAAWQSEALIPLHLTADQQPKGDWLRSMIGLVWGKAPASPA